MINGIDEKSLLILEKLNSNTMKLSEISDLFSVSIDQVKKLSRYNNLLNDVRSHISNTSYNKLTSLGIKALWISSIIKNKDYQILEKMLQGPNDTFSRSVLKTISTNYNSGKRKMVDYEKELHLLDVQISKTLVEIEMLKNTNITSSEILKRIEGQDKDFILCFKEYIGAYNRNLVLRKRIHQKWQIALKKGGVIQYSSEDFLWVVKDPQKLLESMYDRIKSNISLEFEESLITDYQKKHFYKGLFVSDLYRNAFSLDTNFDSYVKALHTKKDELAEHRKKVTKNIEGSISQTIDMERVKPTNATNIETAQKYTNIQHLLFIDFFQKGYVVAQNMSFPKNISVNIATYNYDSKIIFIKIIDTVDRLNVMVSKNDFFKNCNQYYFAFCQEVFSSNKDIIYNYIIGTGCGILVIDNKKITIERTSKQIELNDIMRKETLYSIARQSSRNQLHKGELQLQSFGM